MQSPLTNKRKSLDKYQERVHKWSKSKPIPIVPLLLVSVIHDVLSLP